MRRSIMMLAVAALLGAPVRGLAANGYTVPTAPTLAEVEAAENALAYTLHDSAGGKATRVEQPFAIKAD